MSQEINIERLFKLFRYMKGCHENYQSYIDLVFDECSETMHYFDEQPRKDPDSVGMYQKYELMEVKLQEIKQLIEGIEEDIIHSVEYQNQPSLCQLLAGM